MLVACRLAGLSALETYFAGARARAQCRATRGFSQYALASPPSRSRPAHQASPRTRRGAFFQQPSAALNVIVRLPVAGCAGRGGGRAALTVPRHAA